MINYAHRGASEYAPENTMSAFFLGLQMHANGVETDVRETADGVLVLFHDENTLRTTGQDFKVKELTYDQLLSLDVGLYKGDFFKGEKIVTMEEFLKYFSGKELEFAIEIKALNIEQKVMDLINKYECKNKVTITSYHLDVLKCIRSLDKEIRLGLLRKEYEEGILDLLQSLEIDQYCPMVTFVTKQLVEEAHRRGMTLRTFAVKTCQQMNYAIECGVDGMTINFPDKLYSKMQEMGLK